MGKSIDLWLDEELETIIPIILSKTDDFENQSNLIRVCLKKYLKETYPELLYQYLQNEKKN